MPDPVASPSPTVSAPASNAVATPAAAPAAPAAKPASPARTEPAPAVRVTTPGSARQPAAAPAVAAKPAAVATPAATTNGTPAPGQAAAAPATTETPAVAATPDAGDVRRIATLTRDLRDAKKALTALEEKQKATGGAEAKVTELEAKLALASGIDPIKYARSKGMTFEQMVQGWTEADETEDSPAFKAAREARSEVDALRKEREDEKAAEAKANEERAAREAEERTQRMDADNVRAREHVSQLAASDANRWALSSEPDSVVPVDVGGRTQHMSVSDAVITTLQLSVAEAKKKNPNYRMVDEDIEKAVQAGLDQVEEYLRGQATSRRDKLAKIAEAAAVKEREEAAKVAAANPARPGQRIGIPRTITAEDRGSPVLPPAPKTPMSSGPRRIGIPVGR